MFPWCANRAAATIIALALIIIVAAAAVACDGRREVVMEWPTPAIPVVDAAYESVIRSAGIAGLQDNPDPEALQRYYRARDEFLNAWRLQNRQLAKESPEEYRRVMEQIEEEWDTRYREYWQRQTQDLPADGG